MKPIKTLAAVALAAVLLLPSALAASVEDRFPAVQEFPGYSDVTNINAW